MLDSFERERAATQQVITVLVEEVEFLRYLLLNRPHMHPLNPAMQATEPDPANDDMRKWLSEEEEELLALRLGDHISQSDIEALESALGLDVHTELEPSE